MDAVSLCFGSQFGLGVIAALCHSQHGSAGAGDSTAQQHGSAAQQPSDSTAVRYALALLQRALEAPEVS